jgi:hypothetical protein
MFYKCSHGKWDADRGSDLHDVRGVAALISESSSRSDDSFLIERLSAVIVRPSAHALSTRSQMVPVRRRGWCRDRREDGEGGHLDGAPYWPHHDPNGWLTGNRIIEYLRKPAHPVQAGSSADHDPHRWETMGQTSASDHSDGGRRRCWPAPFLSLRSVQTRLMPATRLLQTGCGLLCC